MKPLGQYITGEIDPFGRRVEHYFGCRVCKTNTPVPTFQDAQTASDDLFNNACKKHGANVIFGTRFLGVTS